MTAHERIIIGYVSLVKSERITINQVPERYREEVRERL